MKTYTLETLNIWGGKVFDPLISHIKKQADMVDIFCFQEVFHTPRDVNYTRQSTQTHASPLLARADIFKQLTQQLPSFQHYFYNVQKNFDYVGKTEYEIYYGLGIFVHKELPIVQEGDLFVYRSENSLIPGDYKSFPRNMAYVVVVINEKRYMIVNVHGIWTGGGKGDTPERIEQSKKVKEFLDTFDGPKILCGDFNLLPDTKSMKIMEKGMRNLVKEFGITSTRSHYYEKEARFADYILVSEDIDVKDFRVLTEVVSDHLPLQLEFS